MVDYGGQRRHLRVRDDIPVNWVTPNSGELRRGIFRNLSLSGALLETKAAMVVEQDLQMTLKAEEAQESCFVPPFARVMWGKPAREGQGYFFYGVQFINPSDDFVKAIEARVENKSQGSVYGLGSGITDAPFGFR
jgi:hypothetical protein